MMCKLVAPLAISELMTLFESERIVAVLVATISTLSWGVECWCVQRVWETNNKLRAPKTLIDHPFKGDESTSPDHQTLHSRSEDQKGAHETPAPLWKVFVYVKRVISGHMLSLQYYFSSSVWIPSVCAAVPHASVLTFSGTLITYLLNAGFSLNTVTVARFVGALFEIGSTFVYPWAVRMLSAANPQVDYYRLRTPDDASSSDNQSDAAARAQEVEHIQDSSYSVLGVVKVGLWSICALCLSLVST